MISKQQMMSADCFKWTLLGVGGGEGGLGVASGRGVQIFDRFFCSCVCVCVCVCVCLCVCWEHNSMPRHNGKTEKAYFTQSVLCRLYDQATVILHEREQQPSTPYRSWPAPSNETRYCDSPRKLGHFTARSRSSNSVTPLWSRAR